MKALTIILGICISALNLFAQNNTLTVTVNGNGNSQVYIDGTNYPLTFVSSNSSRANTAIIENIIPGAHTLQVVNANQNINKRRNVKKFNLRPGYNLDILVNGNGSVTLRESRIRGGRKDNTTSNFPAAMNETSFNALVQDVNSRYQLGSKVAVLNSTFNNTGNFFTTTQVRELLQMVTGDANRLPLAKASFRSVVDPVNFSSLYNLLVKQESRNDLANYIRNFTGKGYPGNTTHNKAMTDESFRTIYNNIQGRWQMGSKISALNTIFITQGNYFSTNQVAQLLNLISDENERFQLAKVSYRTIVDPVSFTSIINSFSTSAIRDDLAYYVRTFDASNPGGGYTYSGVSNSNQAMSEANFNTLYENIRRQWLPGSKKAAVLEAFGSPDNYFMCSQARLLVALVNDEADRLDLAKASYRAIVDPSNFSMLYDLITTQYLKEDLIAFVRTNGTSDTHNNSSTVKTPMSEVSFSTMYEDIRKQWFPGAKKAAVLSAFSNFNYYFTTAQALRLISLDNDEPDRLDMAKASLRSIVDPAKLHEIVDLFTTQAYRDELTSYINNYRW